VYTASSLGAESASGSVVRAGGEKEQRSAGDASGDVNAVAAGAAAAGAATAEDASEKPRTERDAPARSSSTSAGSSIGAASQSSEGSAGSSAARQARLASSGSSSKQQARASKFLVREGSRSCENLAAEKPDRNLLVVTSELVGESPSHADWLAVSRFATAKEVAVDEQGNEVSVEYWTSGDVDEVVRKKETGYLTGLGGERSDIRKSETEFRRSQVQRHSGGSKSSSSDEKERFGEARSDSKCSTASTTPEKSPEKGPADEKKVPEAPASPASSREEDADAPSWPAEPGVSGALVPLRSASSASLGRMREPSPRAKKPEPPPQDDGGAAKAKKGALCCACCACFGGRSRSAEDLPDATAGDV